MSERVTITITGDSSKMTDALAELQRALDVIARHARVQTERVRPGRIETQIFDRGEE